MDFVARSLSRVSRAAEAVAHCILWPSSRIRLCSGHYVLLGDTENRQVHVTATSGATSGAELTLSAALSLGTTRHAVQRLVQSGLRGAGLTVERGQAVPGLTHIPDLFADSFWIPPTHLEVLEIGEVGSSIVL